jgi:glycosyltransferase involved in cell wall biosynthesis
VCACIWQGGCFTQGYHPEDFVPKVSVVIPAKNEEMNIGLVLDDLNRTIEQCQDYDFEVIVVDDKSSDRTGESTAARGARVIRNTGPSGKGRALRLGFANATGDILMMMDADYSHRAEEIPRLLSELNDGAGLVIGSRVYGGSDEYTPIRALGNVFLTYALGAFTGRYLSDALNGFKAFRRDIFDDFTYTSKFFEIEIELIFNALRKGYQVHEVRSHERARLGGEAKSRVIRHGTRFFLRIFTEWLRNRGALRSHARPTAKHAETVIAPKAEPKVANPAGASARNTV